MGREQVAGAIILDKLRQRITSGVYLGNWGRGARLPSIREIADAEQVDRKTAAAAYRRLQEEGLVRVRPRSGIYLSSAGGPDAPGPLERLHRQWLDHTYRGARALGLDSDTMLRLISAVAQIEKLRVPVVECNWSQAEAIATELRERLGIQTMAYLLDELRADDPVLEGALLVITTPYHAHEVEALAPGRRVIDATMAPDVLRELRARSGRGATLVVTGNAVLTAKIQAAVDHCFGRSAAHSVTVLAATDGVDLRAAARGAQTVFLWPGTPEWVEGVLGTAGPPVFRPARAVSEESLGRIQGAILDAAFRRSKEPARVAEEVAFH